MPGSGLSTARAALVVVSFVAVMALMYVAAAVPRAGRHPRLRRRPDVRRAARPHRPRRPGAGAARRLAGLVVHPLRPRRPLLRRLRRGPPQPVGSPARDRAGRRQRQGHPRRHPVAAAVGGAGRAARRRSPPGDFLRGGQRVPRAAGLGGGLRHRGAPRPRPAHGRLLASPTPATPRRPATPRAGPGGAVLDGARGPLLGRRARRARSRGRAGGSTVATRCCSTPTASSSRAGRDLADGIDRMLGVAAMSVLGEGDVASDVCESARSGEDDDRAALAVRL